MDFSSLVLMEKDKETGFITKELGSFEVNEGALYVRKLFVIDNIVNLYFDTNKDVEEWEYSAIYDLFNKDIFIENGFEIDEDLDEYNPTFILKFKYSDEYIDMKEMIDKAVNLISKEMNNVFKNIEGKEEEYKED
jgi:DNA-directed RNA polymerase subunit L